MQGKCSVRRLAISITCPVGVFFLKSIYISKDEGRGEGDEREDNINGKLHVCCADHEHMLTPNDHIYLIIVFSGYFAKQRMSQSSEEPLDQHETASWQIGCVTFIMCCELLRSDINISWVLLVSPDKRKNQPQTCLIFYVTGLPLLPRRREYVTVGYSMQLVARGLFGGLPILVVCSTGALRGDHAWADGV